jgi:hypothetical protein
MSHATVIEIAQLKKTVAQHLASELNLFKEKMGFDSNNQVREYFQKNANIGGTTIQRIVTNQIIAPTPQTAFNIYSTIHKTRNFDELLSKLPSEVALFLSNGLLRGTANGEHCPKTEDYVLENQVALRIYNDCTGFGCELKDIKHNYGEMGLNEVHKLCQMRVLKITRENKVILGEVRLSANPMPLKKRIVFNINNYYRPHKAHDNDENLIASMVEDISPGAYIKIRNEYYTFLKSARAIMIKDEKENPQNKLTTKICLGAFLDKIKE